MAADDLDVTFLGTGTSTGVPMLGCACETCRSADPRDCRWRASLLLRWSETVVVIDTTPEFRLQLLRARVGSLTAVLLTHNHADHIHGLDDVRPFTFGDRGPLPVYGNAATLDWVRRHFCYIWEAEQAGGGLPKVELRMVDSPFAIDGVGIVPIPIWHGRLPIYGYRIGTLAYLSDVSAIPEASFRLLQGVETLILDAVRYRRHPTHFHLAAAIAAARRIGPRDTYLTHLNHDFLHRRLEAELPAGIRPAYDGLSLRIAAGR
jgi:phosphoribosyl 1,2-cyclic phosphate phosphodiesterase